MQHRHHLAAALLSLAALSSAHAVDVTVLPGSGWQPFVVDDPQYSIPGTDFAWHDTTGGGDIAFKFTVAAGWTGTLLVTDAGYAGDVFSVKSNGAALAATTGGTDSFPDGVFDYDAASADPLFSKRSYVFAAGSYTITGALLRSAKDDTGADLNSTVGALKLEVAPVPEASTLAMLLAGLGAIGLLARRRAA